METPGWVDVDEAAAALAAVRRSRARVAWSGYPAWYWFTTGTCLAVGTVAVPLPARWSVAVAAVVVVAVVGLARAASRARGVCEGWVRSAMTWHDALVLYGPAAAVILAGAVVSRFAVWSPWPPFVAAAVVFVLFTGTGLRLSGRAARR